MGNSGGEPERQEREGESSLVCPDWAIYYHLGNFLKPVVTIFGPNFLATI